MSMSNAYRLSVFIAFQAIVAILALEVFLRLSGHFYTYSETTLQGYQTYYGKTANSHYHTNLPHSKLWITNSDFSYQYITNSIGLREREPSILAKDSALRVVTIGDSFTEGMGAPYDSSWPHILEQLIKENGQNALVYNAGSSGSDPFYDVRLYKDTLSRYRPDMLIASVNASDFTDYAYRGGEERFLANGTSQYRNGPWYEGLYEHIHIFRLFAYYCLGNFYGNLFLNKKEFLQNCLEAGVRMGDLFNRLDRLCKTTQTRLVIVLQPSPGDIEFAANDISKIIDTGYTSLCLILNPDIPCINMYAPFRHVMSAHDVPKYSYKNDKHYNGKGYSLYAATLLSELQKRELLID